MECPFLSLRFLRKIKGNTKESARAVSKPEAISLKADSGVVCEDKINDVYHPERNLKRPHRVEGRGTRIGHVVRDIYHDGSGSKDLRSTGQESEGEGERLNSMAGRFCQPSPFYIQVLHRIPVSTYSW
jgi:hypothetical protein